MVRFAGFLPCALDADGQCWLLLGREGDGWGAFGGGPEPGERAYETAVREAWEESGGVLWPALLSVATRRGPVIHSHGCCIYLISRPWECQEQINSVLSAQLGRHTEPQFQEKLESKWFRLRDLQRMRLPLRGPKHLFYNQLRSSSRTITQRAAELCQSWRCPRN